jgi:hypothetical protein
VWRAALTVAVLLWIAVPAQAQNLCVGQKAPKPPPTKEQQLEANLQDWARQRAEFGFRADIPYVRELVKRGVWEYDVGYIPVTPAENAYLKLRDELELGPRAERYLDRHRDIDGGGSIEDDWPHEPYILLHFKRDVAKHLAAVKRLAKYPDNLRADRVRWSFDELRQLGDRIWRDEQYLDTLGFDLQGTGIGDSRLHADLITKRTDAKEFFAKRYGAGVKVEVIATEPFSFACVDAGSYTVAPDGMSVEVRWSSGGGQEPDHFQVTEYPDRVEIGVVDKFYNGPHTDEGRTDVKPAALSAPLGDRVVIDAYDREPLNQIGPRPGQPPCPPAPAERSKLDEAIATRAEYGMRADPEYVRKRLSGRSLFTRAEARWVARLAALEDEEMYVKAKTFAGSRYETKYPAPPRIVFQFKGEARKHLAALRRRSKHPGAVKVVSVDFTAAELEALKESIDEALEPANEFNAVQTSVDLVTGTVLVTLVTARTDHAAYFTGRFGPRVRTVVVGDRIECWRANRAF